MPYVNASGSFTAYVNDDNMFVVPKTKRPLIFVYFQPVSEDKFYQLRVMAQWSNTLVIANSHDQIQQLGASKRLKLNPAAVEFGGTVYNMTNSDFTLDYENIVPYWHPILQEA